MTMKNGKMKKSTSEFFKYLQLCSCSSMGSTYRPDPATFSSKETLSTQLTAIVFFEVGCQSMDFKILFLEYVKSVNVRNSGNVFSLLEPKDNDSSSFNELKSPRKMSTVSFCCKDSSMIRDAVFKKVDSDNPPKLPPLPRGLALRLMGEVPLLVVDVAPLEVLLPNESASTNCVVLFRLEKNRV